MLDATPARVESRNDAPMSAQGPGNRRPPLTRLTLSTIVAVVVAAVAWSAPRTLGTEAGLTTCVLLAASGGTMAALVVGHPRHWSIAVGLLSLALVAAACMTSAAYAGNP